MKTNLADLANAKALAALSIEHGSDKTRYCPIYEMYLGRSRENDLNFFEIGVGGYEHPEAGGASLRMWKDYLPNARIYALDFYDKRPHVTDRVQIYQGSQDDEALLHQIVADIGRMDVVLDDGSHMNAHIIKSFQILFPLLVSGGLYIVEDVGTSYWTEYGGSAEFGDEKTAVGYFKRMADGLNYMHMKHGYEPTELERAARFVHFWENIVIIGKA